MHLCSWNYPSYRYSSPVPVCSNILQCCSLLARRTNASPRYRVCYDYSSPFCEVETSRFVVNNKNSILERQSLPFKITIRFFRGCTDAPNTGNECLVHCLIRADAMVAGVNAVELVQRAMNRFRWTRNSPWRRVVQNRITVMKRGKVNKIITSSQQTNYQNNSTRNADCKKRNLSI